MPEVNAASDNIRSQYLGQDRSVNIQKEIKERSQIEDGKLGGVEFRDKPKQMDRDDFLKLLVKQLTTQDPTAPVQDQQFIAQMAQFSALEQMKNMADGFNNLSNRQAINLVGKFVIGKDFTSGESVSGVAQALFFDSTGQAFIKVGGRAVTLKDIEMVGDPSMIKQEFGGSAANPPPVPPPAGQSPVQPAHSQSQTSSPAPALQKTDEHAAPTKSEVPLKSEGPANGAPPEKNPEKKGPVSLRGYGDFSFAPNFEFVS
ncbi:MAG: endoflagellar hook capping protein [Leptospirales bacterium]|nr:endoflagellar hook capping protein [Leptospirales bacterium]